MLLSLRDVLLLVQFINRWELHCWLRKQVLIFVIAFSVPADWYLRFPYLHFPPLQIHTYVCSTCTFHPQESHNFILPISILAFSSIITLSAPRDYFLITAVTDYSGHRRTLLSTREIFCKTCAPGIRTRNLPADPGIEPGYFRQTVPVSAHCVCHPRHRGRRYTSFLFNPEYPSR